MLRIEKVNLVTTGFNEDELTTEAGHGKATLSLNGTSIATGAFHLVDQGAATMANIAVSGKPSGVAAAAVNTLTVQLTQKVVRKLSLSAATNEVIPVEGTVLAVTALAGGLDEGEVAPTGDVALSAVDGNVKNTGTVSAAGKVMAEITLLRGTGAAVDECVMDNIKVEDGELHVNALARAIDYPDLKPHLTNMAVRGTSSIHF